jgi:large subunit ribosomal protein L22
MDIRSTQKFVITSPRKLREIVAEIKRLKLTPEAVLDRLDLVNKRASKVIKKVVKAAVSNALQLGVDAKDLVFREIQINEGPTLKRYRAGSRGRGKPYRRRMAHIRVVLAQKADMGGLNKAGVKKAENSSVTKAKKESVRKKKGGKI